MSALIVGADRVVTDIGPDDEPRIVEGAAVLVRDGTIAAVTTVP